MSDLNAIKSPIKEHIFTYQKVFRDTVRSNVPLLNVIMQYITRSRGKEIRPIIVLYTAQMVGEINETTYEAATLVELLHTATLVHDDVVDDSYKRRGMFSINALWKNKIAVLAGDYLLSRGLLLAVEKEHPHLLLYVSKATRDMSEGELLQIEKARKLDISEELYFEVIRKKTASLLASCFAIGAYSTIDDKEQLEKLWLIGEYTGIAFQIMDDMLDFQKTSVTGKPTGNDLREKKVTLPLIYLLNHCPGDEKKNILRLLRSKKKKDRDLEEIKNAVIQSGGMDYSRDKMNEYKAKALELLYHFPDNSARKALEQIIEFIINRDK